MPDQDSSRKQNFATARLLIDEQPLQVLRSLAVTVGLNEAIILQQLHYEMRLERHVFEGVSWVYYTYEQWQKHDFPFWSTDTIKRAIYHLEERGLIISTMRFNHSAIDRRKWYTLNYDKLNELGYAEPTTGQNATTTVHNVELDVADCPDGHSKTPRLPKIPTKITTQEQDPLPTGEGPTRKESKPQLTLVKPAKPSRSSRRCPADYIPSPDVYDWAHKRHPEIDTEAALEDMKDHEFKNGHSDWDATFRSWIRREVKLNTRHRIAAPATQGASALPAWWYGKD